ncbi:pyridoxal phosphate-dependent aminotransferase [Selenomonas sp. TAMA-11512]|uniref:pyridoxal phosphate-dependent aminotransferase n=1 Tax=Selenomonas sp. TAMA-11512 TaxID=3095337 RepID=UPI00309185E0|nr:pyridoxal phosphate-dependent aminotransferase [Selenomonas sp. TAMA-11512]
MVNEKMLTLGTKKSTIRTIFEYGQKRIAEVGAENVYDFSLGNPNVPTPEYIKEAAVDILQTTDPAEVHGYTVAPGKPAVRAAIAEAINERFSMQLTSSNIFMTAGAAAAITICFKALNEESDEFITIAPFFPEYQAFVESVGGRLVIVPPKRETFQIDFTAFECSVTPKTKAVIVNSPNNPSGAVYSEETIKKLAEILEAKEREYAHPIFIIADEPYREIAYERIEVPYIPHFYKNTLVCYSYSKSFSLAGERIGYIVVPSEVDGFAEVYGAIAGAGRVLTHVNAPSLWQLVVARCAKKPSDISAYEENGRILYEGLIEAGFTCLKPQGAFYLFPKALEEDDRAFCEKAKKYDLLLVPGSDFGCPGHFRASYCIRKETIEQSIPVFKKLAEEYRKK